MILQPIWSFYRCVKTNIVPNKINNQSFNCITFLVLPAYTNNVIKSGKNHEIYTLIRDFQLFLRGNI